MKPLLHRVRTFHQLPLRVVLVVPFLVQIFVAVGVTGWLSVRNGREAVRTTVAQLGSTATDRIIDRVRHHLYEAHHIHKINAAAIENGILDLENFADVEANFRSQVRINENIDYLFFANEDGHFIGVQRYPDGREVVKFRDANTAPERWIYLLDENGDRVEQLKQHEYDPRTRPWYATAKLSGRPSWSDVYASADLDVLQITPVHPVYNEAGELQGVLAANLLLSQIGDFLEELSLSPTGQAFIVEPSGELIASSEPEVYAIGSGDEKQQNLASNSESPLIRATIEEISREFGTLNAIETVQEFAYFFEDTRQLVRVTPFRDEFGLEWLVVVAIPETDFMAEIEKQTRTTILLCFVAAGIATIMGLFTSRWINATIERLGEASRKMAGGKIDRQVPSSPIYELNILATSFNRMAAQLRQSFAELEERVEQRTAQLKYEKEKSENLLLNILPEPIAHRLKQDPSAIAEHFEEATILFADIVGFTPLSSRLNPVELVTLLDRIFSRFDDLAEQFDLEKIKTIGDAYMVVGGLPVPRADHVEAIAKMALEMQRSVEEIRSQGHGDLEIRIGINTGVVVAGVIGRKKFIYDLWGDAVNVASRMESSGEPGKIQVTAAVYQRLRDRFLLEERGSVAVKGKGKMVSYWLVAERSPQVVGSV